MDEPSPFAEYTRKQREAKKQDLSLVDKISLVISGMLLSSKYMRAVFVIYLLSMHLFVLGILYGYSAPSVPQRPLRGLSLRPG